MSIKITSNVGSGSIQPDSLVSYSYSEDVTSIDPTTSNGGTSQVTFSALSNNTSPFLINNTMQLDDSISGSVAFRVKGVAINAGVASITGDTLMARLNVEKTAQPVGGPIATPASLLDAINYYCELTDIVPGFDDGLEASLDLIPVNFIGWSGNLWEHLKMLCSVASFSLTDNAPIEMYFSVDELRFREALARNVDYSEKESDSSVTIDAFDAAKAIKVSNYSTSYGEDKVFYELSNYDAAAEVGTTFNSSIDDILQVDAGATVTKRFKIDASLTSVNQPTCVGTITRVPPAPYADGGNGEYVIVGSDNLPIDPTQWNDLGGSVIINLTENPNEIEITITAPPSETMPTEADPATEVTPAPYKIGAESSGLADYPALWLTGTGVFFEKKDVTFLTGADDAYTSNDNAPAVDNPFITDLHTLSNAGIAAAQSYCGPSVVISKAIGQPGVFGETIGQRERIGDNVFRYESASYGPASVQLAGRMYTLVNEFDENWVDATFATFNAAVNGLTFNEFTVAPLTKGI